jgi:serine O-acetyltransferase
MRLINTLLRLQRLPLVGRFGRELLFLCCACDIPPSVRPGRRFKLLHRGLGVVLHPTTKIGDDVVLYHGVTVGRQNIVPYAKAPPFAGAELCDEVVLGAHSMVLAPDKGLRVGRGTVLAANSVLLESTGEYEVWAGNPAKRLSSSSPLAKIEAAAAVGVSGRPDRW